MNRCGLLVQRIGLLGFIIFFPWIKKVGFDLSRCNDLVKGRIIFLLCCFHTRDFLNLKASENNFYLLKFELYVGWIMIQCDWKMNGGEKKKISYGLLFSFIFCVQNLSILAQNKALGSWNILNGKLSLSEKWSVFRR